MHTTSVVLVIALLVITFVCGGAVSGISQNDVKNPDFSAWPSIPKTSASDLVITLERTPCFGTCPSYMVSLFGNGTFVYTGTRCVEVKGVKKGKISTTAVKKLVRAFETAHFTSMNDSYDEMMITDMPSAIVSFSQNGQKKQVYHYKGDMNAPAGLPFLENAIDAAVNTKKYIGTRQNISCMTE
jgi:hypothetical protein